MEIWKDISGYEGLYQVSNYGYIKALPKTVYSGVNYTSIRKTKEKILKLSYDTKGNYLYIALHNQGKHKRFSVHYLVLSNFNPVEHSYKYEINHINGIKDDNHLSNLEWVTSKENSQHALKNGLLPHLKPVEQLTLEGEFIQKFSSITEATNHIGVKGIGAVCSGKRKSCGGYKWRYVK